MIGLAILFGTALGLLIAGLSAMLVHEMRHPPRRTAGYALAHAMATDPSDLGLDFEQWMLTLGNGIALPVWDVRGLASDEKERITTVLAHGWGHSRIHSLERVKAFLPHCHRVLMYDLRGHGEAKGGSSRLGDREQKDLIELLKASRRMDEPSSSGERFVLAGHSMGAVICLAAAAEHARLNDVETVDIAGVIAYGPYTKFHRSLIGRLKAAGLPARPMTDLALAWHGLTGVRPLSLRDEALRQVNCPVLIVHGGKDVVAPIEHGEHIASIVPGTVFELFLDAGHVDAHVKDVERHAQLIAEFFQRVAVKQ
ncbi:MAG TPA: alpha/beta fold hydrolase [Phycisphaerales bacterium]|nr:alpha/beta fold hydrolase [Phycisphaerales bacterium]